MFERLAGKLLSRLLSKYFICPEDTASPSPSSSTSSKNGSSAVSKTAQLGVWSGYISLDNLILRKEVVNDYFLSNGLPFELKSCTLGRVEITVPWGKIGRLKKTARGYEKRSSSFSSNGDAVGGGGDDASVIVVVDGIHVLLATRYDFDDDAIERARVAKRRKVLASSETFVKSEENGEEKFDKETGDEAASSTFSGISGFFKKRLTEGILNDVLDKIHIHIRDLHVRLEDVESDFSPFGCGITLESLHVHSDQEELTSFMNVVRSETKENGATTPTKQRPPEEFIRKIVQLNHLAIYCNSLDYEEGTPPELSVLQCLGEASPRLSQAMQRCIARRSLTAPLSSSSSISSSVGTISLQMSPAHSYVLVPVDAICQATLSKDPRNLQLGPALVAAIRVETFALELRNFQYSHMLGLTGTIQYHNYARRYRRHRPRVPVKDDPRAWWAYAIKVIQMELRESHMRWSWQRFHRRYALRKRYCELYERQIQFGLKQDPSKSTNESGEVSIDQGAKIGDDSAVTVISQNQSVDGNGLDKLADKSDVSLLQVSGNEGVSKGPLSQSEVLEIQEMEDGTCGDLSVHDIIIFRAVVNAKIAGSAESRKDGGKQSSRASSGMKRFLKSMISDDLDAEQEYERLLAYLDSISKKKELPASAAKNTHIAVFIQSHLKHGSISFSAPRLLSTDHLHRCLYERFLELNFDDLCTNYTLLGNYDSFQLDLSLSDLNGSEIRTSGKKYVLFSRLEMQPASSGAVVKNDENAVQNDLTTDDKVTALVAENSSGRVGLFRFDIFWKPPQNPECDLTFSARLEEIDMFLLPDCEWPRRIKSLFSSGPITPNAFWEDLRMVYINSLKSAKAGLQAKAEKALFKHKNIDLNVHINCPVLRIGDREGSYFVIDLGEAHFVTERLAGVSTGKLNYSLFRRQGGRDGDTEDNPDSGRKESISSANEEARFLFTSRDSFDDSSSELYMPMFSGRKLSDVESAMRSTDAFSLGSSAGSFDGNSKRPRSSSLSILAYEGALSTVSERKDRKDGAIGMGRHRENQSARLIESCFYDVFCLRLRSGTVSFSDREYSKQFKFLQGLEVNLLLEKSVIPSDHTIPRIKAHCVVNNVTMKVSQSSLLHLGCIMKSWSSIPVDENPVPFSSALPEVSVHEPNKSIHSVVKARRTDEQDSNSRDDQSEASSGIDELEFLDALDDEVVEENPSSWFEDRWIADAESMYEIENRTTTHSQRRRRLPSISDVSSASERSRKTRGRQRDGNVYLSAENLARLDEVGAEENQSKVPSSESEVSQMSDADSFHSAMSPGGLVELANALLDDIIKADEDVVKLKRDIKSIEEKNFVENGSVKESLGLSTNKSRRRLREELKLELMRSEAEVRALRATYQDMTTELEAARQLESEKRIDSNEENFQPIRDSSETSPSEVVGVSEGQEHDRTSDVIKVGASDHVARARALLKARSLRSSSQKHISAQHALTSGLSRELFSGTLLFTSVTIKILGADDAGDINDVTETDESILGVTLSKLMLTLHSKTFDTRFYASVEHLHCSSVNEIEGGENSHENILLQGGRRTAMKTPLASQFPHLVSFSFAEEKFLRVAVDLRHRRKGNSASKRGGSSIKVRVVVGSLELSPDCSAISRCISLWETAQEMSAVRKTAGCNNETVTVETSRRSLFERVVYSVMVRSKDKCETAVAEGGHRETGASVDFSFKANSAGLRIADGKQPLGAFVFTGFSVRFGRILSPTVYNCRGQLDVRCANVQIIDITEDNSLKARELFGRRDAFLPILHARARMQLVPADHLGGWVVDGQNLSRGNGDKQHAEEKAWNMHVGFKSNSMCVTASVASIKQILNQTSRLIHSAKVSSIAENAENKNIRLNVGESHIVDDGKTPDDSPVSSAKRSKTSSNSRMLCVRWRVDAAVKDASFVFPCKAPKEIDLTENPGNNICVATSVKFSLQPELLIQENVSVGGSLNLSAFRSSDDWLLVEPLTITYAVSAPLPLFSSAEPPSQQLNLPTGSVWLEAVGRERSSRPRPSQGIAALGRLLEISWSDELGGTVLSSSLHLTPVRINFSAQTHGLLLDAIRTMHSKTEDRVKKSRVPRDESKKDSREQISSNDLLRTRIELLCSVEIMLHREPKTGGNRSYPHPQVLLSAKHVELAVGTNGREGVAALSIDTFSLFDLSTQPGVRCLGNGFTVEEKFSTPETKFQDGTKRKRAVDLTILLKAGEKHGILTVDLNTGRIQCLLLPSLLSSLLEFMSHLKRPEKVVVEYSTPVHQKRSNADILEAISLPFGVGLFQISSHIAEFELLLASRDIPGYLKTRSMDSISVVAVRWKSSFDMKMSLCRNTSHLESSGESNCLLFSDIHAGAFEEDNENAIAVQLWDDFICQHQDRAVDTVVDEQRPYLKSVGTSRLVLKIEDFQVLRTCVKRLSHTELIAAGFDSSSCFFVTSPPVAGEQQVVSPFTCRILHNLAATSFSIAPSSEVLSLPQRQLAFTDFDERKENSLYGIIYAVSTSKVSQSLQIDVGLIDILLYLRQGKGGMNDAFKFTVRPLIDMLENRKQNNPVQVVQHQPRKYTRQTSQQESLPIRPSIVERDKDSVSFIPKVTVAPTAARQKTEASLLANMETSIKPASPLKESLKNSILVLSARAVGIQVTCVPGGATRLTEAPIMKVSVKGFESGLAMIPVPKDVNFTLTRVASENKFKIGDKDALGSRFSNLNSRLSHLEAGLWMEFEVSAYYHNRRLVAWEPVVEPWKVECRLGVDLMRILNISPSRFVDWSLQSAPPVSVTSPSISGIIHDNFNERAGEKIRDIGRLLRSSIQSVESQFGLDVAFKNSTEEAPRGAVGSHSDASHLLLYAIAKSSLDMALCKYVQKKSINPLALEPTSMSTLLLPSRNELQWLKQHGFPSAITQSERKGESRTALLVSLSDAKPLNFNITGALIENVVGFMGSQDIGEDGKNESKPLAPHWIRNGTGLTIRFNEILDNDRLRRGEKSKTTTLANGCQIPLSLKRDISQSCDPHRAFINVELENSESGSELSYNLEPSRYRRSRYKIIGKVPVDTVGVYAYSFYLTEKSRLERMEENGVDRGQRRAAGSIIARVALSGGTKIVSIESPVLLKNATDALMHCEIRARGSAQRPLWHATLPSHLKMEGTRTSRFGDTPCVPVPVDLLPSADSGLLSLSVITLPNSSAEIKDKREKHGDFSQAVCVHFPPPFSEKSAKWGVVRNSEISMEMTSARERVELNSKSRGAPFVHLSVCSLRIGKFSPENFLKLSERNASDTQPAVPEQRMLVFRPPVAFKNHLPVAIAIQARVKDLNGGLRRYSSSKALVARSGDVSTQKHQDRWVPSAEEWEDLGVISCGETKNWTGAVASDAFEIRVRIAVDDVTGGYYSLEFPTWSTATAIPSEDEIAIRSNLTHEDSLFPSKLVVKDAGGIPLQLSVALEKNKNVAADGDSATHENIRMFAQGLPAASRVVGIYVPFWVVDGTGLELEFKTETPVAGQSDDTLSMDEVLGQHHTLAAKMSEQGSLHRGLADLLSDDGFAHLKARAPFDIFMIGDEKSNKLSMRRRVKGPIISVGYSRIISPWSDPIALNTRGTSHQKISVQPPGAVFDITSNATPASWPPPLALNSHIVCAPERFGGHHGTKMIHIVNRYTFLNGLDREIEVMSHEVSSRPVIVGVNGQSTPFHFDDSGTIRFRPKEFGWGWSGAFSLKKKRREVMLRLRNKLTGKVIIGNVEFFKNQKSHGTVVMFRAATHPPFRLENHTMQPLQFGQTSKRQDMHTIVSVSTGENVSRTTLLPYHNADYAWDEPDVRGRSIFIEVADFADSIQNAEHRLLGSFDLDQFAPGTRLKMWNNRFAGEVVADGPTRVLRIMDATLPRLPSDELRESEQGTDLFIKLDRSSQIPHSIEIKLLHGIGISVVDWSPQELMYLRVADICIETRVDSGVEDVTVSVGCVSADNQMWVTPYPVLLFMGRRNTGKMRRRRRNAINLSWSRELNTHGGHDGLTLLRRVELSTQPLALKVDGNLFVLLWKMLNKARGTGSDVGNSSRASSSRDSMLCNILGLDQQRQEFAHGVNNLQKNSRQGGSEVLDSFVMTAAMAARSHTHSPSTSFKGVESSVMMNGISLGQPMGKKQHAPSPDMTVLASTRPLTKPRRKYYVEKMKISRIEVEVSWTGALPGVFFSLPDLMRPALTFEGLPVMLRPYSDAHAYGTIEDHLQHLKSHYLNVWRIIDLFVGLAFKPTFIVRACLYTSRQSVAKFFGSLSQICASGGEHLLKWSPSRVMEPTYLLEDPEFETASRDLGGKNAHQEKYLFPRIGERVVLTLYSGIVGRAMTLSASLLRSSASINSIISSSFRYGGSSGGIDESKRRRGGGVESVRIRAPRLFANQDGKDLLVEYVEGENAGKALLSRVRMGMLLGEGYICHGEGAYLRSAVAGTPFDPNAKPLIFMMTSERLLLLDGGGNLNYSTVLWEVRFDEIVLLELEAQFVEEKYDALYEDGENIAEIETIPDRKHYDAVQFWYVQRSHRKPSERSPVVSMVPSCSGLGTLLFKMVYFPSGCGKMVLSEVSRANSAVSI